METKHPGVFAIGDVTSLQTSNGYTPFLSKVGSLRPWPGGSGGAQPAVRITGRGRDTSWDGHGACFLEVARGKSAYMYGNFLATPRPHLTFRTPGAIYHTQKVLFDKYWMRHWF
jgi:sulfide:quinone oxidoreductase